MRDLKCYHDMIENLKRNLNYVLEVMDISFSIPVRKMVGENQILEKMPIG